MNETILTWLIFILAFGGMVLIHEFGHYIVARWAKIEVEEFGVGLPTPGALTLWSNKGYLLLDDGGRIEIPANFRLPANWSELVDHQVRITADRVEDRLVMRSIEVVGLDDSNRYPDARFESLNAPADQMPSRRVIKAGKPDGALNLHDVVTEVRIWRGSRSRVLGTDGQASPDGNQHDREREARGSGFEDARAEDDRRTTSGAE